MTRKVYLYKKGRRLEAAHLGNRLGEISALKKRAASWLDHALHKNRPQQADAWFDELKDLSTLEIITYAKLLKIQIPRERQSCL